MKELNEAVVKLHDIARMVEYYESDSDIAKAIRNLADSLSDKVKGKN